MSTHEQQITNNPTSAVRNTGGRNGPQGLEEPMSDEVLREMCDKNYHQLLPLIAEKMQKEKEQKDKLNAVKARLIYGEESGIKIRTREESHYSESKTPTARTEPRRRHGDRYSRSPSPHTSVFKRLKKYRSPSPRPRPRKEGGVFNRLGRKEPATSARSDSRQRSPQAKRTEVEARRRQQKGTPSRTTSQYSKNEDSEGGLHGFLNNACPKDCYPLPEIDWKVESLCGYSFKCFLDAYKGLTEEVIIRGGHNRKFNPATDKHENWNQRNAPWNARRNVLRLQVRTNGLRAMFGKSKHNTLELAISEMLMGVQKLNGKLARLNDSSKRSYCAVSMTDEIGSNTSIFCKLPLYEARKSTISYGKIGSTGKRVLDELMTGTRSTTGDVGCCFRTARPA
ncbi:hypothetical protein Tco_0888279 [Tanacetum coccineum]